MLSEAVRRAQRPSLRSRSIPTLTALPGFLDFARNDNWFGAHGGVIPKPRAFTGGARDLPIYRLQGFIRWDTPVKPHTHRADCVEIPRAAGKSAALRDDPVT